MVLSDITVEQITCFASLLLLFLIGVIQIYYKRKSILYFLRHGKFKPELQKRVCPGCNSDDLTLLSNKGVKCNSCGTIFASTSSLKVKENTE